MKNQIIKIVAGCVLMLLVASGGYSQTTAKVTKVSGKKIAKIEKAKVPKEVTDVWITQYPMASYENWYGYPAYDDYLSNWYYDWYDYDYAPYVYTDYPEYYVAEFTQDNTKHKVVYNKSGKKIATHKKLQTDLPAAVSTALNSGEYKGWKIGTEKDEIFNDTDKDQLKVYKVEVEKGKEKHILFFQEDGKLLKDKKLKALTS